MPLQPLKATRPKHWSKKQNSLLRNPATAVLILLMLFAAGCVEEPGGSESGQEDLQAEVERQDEPSDGQIQTIDDERSVERRLRDAMIAARIRTALVETKELRRFDFDPVVVNGRVLLRGEVSTQEERGRAAQVAEGVEGVSGVVNEITATEEPTPEEPDDAARDSMIAAMDAAQSSSGDTAATTSPASSNASQTAGSEEEAEESTAYHTVRSGESLWIIANRNGVTIAQIRQLNDLRSDNLKPGQRLRVK